MSKRRKRRTPQAGDEREAPRDATAAWPVSVRRTLVAVGVAGLLGAHFLPAATSIRHKCCTFDEIAHVTRGYSFWNHRDKRLISHHPPLAYAWATLPLLNDELEFPSFEQDTWYQSDVYALGKEFFYRLGNDPDAMLRQARLMITALSVALGLCVFVFSRRRFGTTGAFVSLILYTFSPTILAHARLATTDIPASLFFLLSVTSIWWMLHRVSIVSVLVGAAALAGLFLTKMSAVVVIPMSLILLVIRLIVGKPLAIKLVKEWTLTARWKMAPVFLGVAFTYVLVVYAAIWGAYGFRYESMVGAEPGRDRYYAPPADSRGRGHLGARGATHPRSGLCRKLDARTPLVSRGLPVHDALHPAIHARV